MKTHISALQGKVNQLKHTQLTGTCDLSISHKICIIFRKYDGRGKIYIERDDSTGHWQVKPRSWLKTGTLIYWAYNIIMVSIKTSI